MPIFVLGAPRSATTVVSKSLAAVGWNGFGEGHVLGILEASVRAVAERQSDYLRHVGKSDWAIEHFPLSQLQAGLISAFEDFHIDRFGPRWMDKTPGIGNITIAPQLRRLFPKSKFIFCRRRAIDVLGSMQRRFGHDYHSLLRAADEWVNTMSAWRAVREELGAAAIEIDHRQVADNPCGVAAEISGLLGLAEEDSAAISAYLQTESPEATSTHYEAMRLSQAPWPDDVKAALAERLSFCMGLFGYGLEEPFIDESRSVPIKYTRNANFADLSQLSVATYYKYISDDRFLLHPGAQESPRSAVLFKSVDIDGAVAISAVCEIAHSQSQPIRCGIEVLCDGVAVSSGEVLVRVEESCRLTLMVPPDLTGGEIVVWTEMAHGASNEYAWLNIVNLQVIKR